jgi:hypothetical protein
MLAQHLVRTKPGRSGGVGIWRCKMEEKRGCSSFCKRCYPSCRYKQLDVVRTITAMAVAARVSKLQLETGNSHLKLAEKENSIHVLQQRSGDPESTLHETCARLSGALGEQVWELLMDSLDVSRLSKGS